MIKELLGYAHIGVTATVYAHVRLRLQRDAIDLLGNALREPVKGRTTATNHRFVQHSSANVAVNYCRQTPHRPRRKPIQRGLWLIMQLVNGGIFRNPLSSSEAVRWGSWKPYRRDPAGPLLDSRELPTSLD